jgi:two-component system response regulator CpxR
MTVIAIDAALFCDGPALAAAVAGQLGYGTLGDEELFADACSRFGAEEQALRRTVYGPQSLFGSGAQKKVKRIAYLRAAFAEALKRDDFVYQGFCGHLVPGSVSHLLRVGAVATRAHRLERAKQEKLGETEAEKRIDLDDEAHARWMEQLFDRRSWEKDLFDILIAMHECSFAEAVALVCDNAVKPAVSSGPRSRKSVQDFRLACQVQLLLVEKGHDVDVVAEDGRVTVLNNQHAVLLGRLEKELEREAGKIAGVKEVEVKAGPRYREPNIYVNLNIEMPGRVLLVDDEKEFVNTLSERLQARSIESTVAYDGEQALDAIEREEPEVMVLDLKMPGIDGLEVLRRVKQKNPATEVIILTGHGSEVEEELAERLGAFAYLRKPVDIKVLTETMQAAYKKLAEARERKVSG